MTGLRPGNPAMTTLRGISAVAVLAAALAAGGSLPPSPAQARSHGGGYGGHHGGYGGFRGYYGGPRFYAYPYVPRAYYYYAPRAYYCPPYYYAYCYPPY